MKLKVKIAVAANSDGEWHAYGYRSTDDGWDDMMDSFDMLTGEQRFWVEAEIEVADQPAHVTGTVTAA